MGGFFAERVSSIPLLRRKLKSFISIEHLLYTVEKKNMEKTFSATVSAERQPVKLID